MAGDRRLALVAAGSALVAVVGTLVATRWGPGVSPDSAAYLSAGLNLAGGRGIESFRGDPVTAFPPGLSAVVAVGHGLGPSVGWTVRLFNAATVAAVVVMAHALLRRHVRDVALVVAGTVVVAVSAPILSVAQMAWSELAFIAVCLAFLLVLERLLASPTLPLSLLAGGLAALGFLFRYAGMTLVVVGVLVVVVASWSGGRRRAAAAIGAFLVAACTLPLAWVLRNRAADGTLMGPRFPSSDSPVVTAKRFVNTIGGWAVPDPAPSALRGPVGLLVVGVLVAWAALALRAGLHRPTGAPGVVPAGAPLLPLAAFVVVYAVYVVAAQLSTAIDPIDTRLLSPLYVPLVVLGAIILDPVTVGHGTDHRAGHRLVPRSAVVVALVAVVLVQALAFARLARASAIDGNGYATPSWQSSALARSVDRLPDDVDLYSNGSDALWTVLHRQPLLQSPAKGLPRSNATQDLPPAFLTDVACQTSFLAWFDTIDRPYLFTPEDLRTYVRLDEVAEDADGTLYRIRPKEPPATTC